VIFVYSKCFCCKTNMG